MIRIFTNGSKGLSKMERTETLHIKRTMVPGPHAPPIFCIKIYLGTKKHEIVHTNPKILDQLVICYLEKQNLLTPIVQPFGCHDDM